MILRIFPKIFWEFEPPIDIKISLLLFSSQENSYFNKENRDFNKNSINIIIESIKDCIYFKQTKDKLNSDVTSKLNAFFEAKKDKYFTLKHIIDVFKTPHKDRDILGDYGSILMQTADRKQLISPLSDLSSVQVIIAPPNPSLHIR